MSFKDRQTDKLLCESDFSNNLRRRFLWTKGWPTVFWTWQSCKPFPVGYCQIATFYRRGVRLFPKSQPERVKLFPPSPLLIEQTPGQPSSESKKCHGKFGDASNYRDQMHKEEIPPRFPTPLWSRKSHVDLPLDLGKVHGKFGCAGTYGVQMHKEQTNKQTNKQTFFFIYRDSVFDQWLVLLSKGSLLDQHQPH